MGHIQLPVKYDNYNTAELSQYSHNMCVYVKPSSCIHIYCITITVIMSSALMPSFPLIYILHDACRAVTGVQPSVTLSNVLLASQSASQRGTGCSRYCRPAVRKK